MYHSSICPRSIPGSNVGPSFGNIYSSTVFVAVFFFLSFPSTVTCLSVFFFALNPGRKCPNLSAHCSVLSKSNAVSFLNTKRTIVSDSSGHFFVRGCEVARISVVSLVRTCATHLRDPLSGICGLSF